MIARRCDFALLEHVHGRAPIRFDQAERRSSASREVGQKNFNRNIAIGGHERGSFLGARRRLPGRSHFGRSGCRLRGRPTRSRPTQHLLGGEAPLAPHAMGRQSSMQKPIYVFGMYAQKVSHVARGQKRSRARETRLDPLGGALVSSKCRVERHDLKCNHNRGQDPLRSRPKQTRNRHDFERAELTRVIKATGLCVMLPFRCVVFVGCRWNERVLFRNANCLGRFARRIG